MRNRFRFLMVNLLIINLLIAQKPNSPKINGRIQYDFEFIKRQKDTAWFQGNEFRRVHLSFKGKTGSKLKYKIEVNFASGKIGFRDLFIQYSAGKYGQLAIGSMAEPTGLNMMTSSKYISFTERAMLTALQNFRWGAGLHYQNYQLFRHKAGLQLSLTNNGANDKGFADKALNEGMNFAGRFFLVPYSTSNNHALIHLGMNFASRPAKDLKFRAENHMGEKYHYVFPGAKRRLVNGSEIALTYSSLSLQGEYKCQQLSGREKNYTVKAYYLKTGYFITGEYKPYKHGSFGRVKPLKDIDHGGLGAFEIVLRYSVMEVNRAVSDINPGQPGRIANWGIGFNWYLNARAKVMYNYILTDDDNPSGNQAAHLLRFQIDF